MELYWICFILSMLILTYQLIVDFVDLSPFNDIQAKSDRGRFADFFMNYTPLLLIAIGFWIHSKNSLIWSSLGLLAYSLSHINTWWIPYIIGPSNTVLQQYKIEFGKTHTFLPRRKHSEFIPVTQHVVLGLLLLSLTGLSLYHVYMDQLLKTR